MFVHYRTRGIILKKNEREEADRLFTIYTRDFGKLEILGKAIRKIKSKLRGGAELFYLSEIEFIQGKAHKTLTDAILVDNFENIRKNLERLKITYQIADIFDNLIGEEEPDEKIWQLLLETFNKLNNEQLTINNWQLAIIYYYFLWNLLSLLGYQPELYNCSSCQRKIVSTEKIYFSFKEGGIVCQRCFVKIVKQCHFPGREINADTIKILRLILAKKWDILTKLRIESHHKEFLKLLSDNSLSFILNQR